MVTKEFFSFFLHPLPQWLARQFDHAPWTGFTAWDLMMPLFLFIVGAAMPFSIGKRVERGDKRGSIYHKVFRRAVVLWILGMIAQGNLLYFNLNNLQIYCNTLQAIAAGYVISAVALVELSVSGQAVLAGSLLLAYWALMRFVPMPGHKAGDLTPHGNLAMWVDNAVLGRFQDGSDYTWILSSMGFGATTLIGVLAGNCLRGPKSKMQKVLLLSGWGLLCLGTGWLWSCEFPIIKHIWTSSMALWAGGWSLLSLASFYWVIDVLGLRRWAFFFVVFGMNAILAYLIPSVIVAYTPHEVINFDHVQNAIVTSGPGLRQALGDFLLTAGALGLLWAGLYYLYRRKIFLRI